ncbi:hypothetical protein [Deinococcus maricopensis]|uniref:Uncharacterized protein n=1 Tax=Deinococcus maricopensis (strain DSM 21211 / LMG 22137 / NRRL B-23946 / LB-34) TaxID=709986 RepID=E8U6X4_DEIML|nr:hypothetical protein [Deinococcus maricopensis]ADV66813.1 hypothetical protein Deima_1161 [Deinococcus maricopensis DSM 21211]
MPTDEPGLLYWTALDGHATPDTTDDPRVLILPGALKDRTLRVLWAPAGDALGVTFEPQDLRPGDLPVLQRTLRSVQGQTEPDADLAAFLRTLDAYLTEAAA